jgi:predicted PurR-regulated permease PerM
MGNVSNTGPSHVQQILFNLAAFVIVVAGMRASSEILIPFLLAIFISVVANPLVIKLRSRRIPIIGAIVIVILGIIAIGIGITSLLGTSLNDFSDNLPQYKEMLNNSATDFFQFFEDRGLHISGSAIIQRFDPGAAMSLTSSILSGLGGALSSGLLILLMVIFMLLEATIFKYKVRHVFGSQSDGASQVDAFSNTINRYMLIKTGTSLATGIIATIWLMIIGVDYPLLWGFLTFLFNYVPTIGSIIAAVPPALLALIQFGVFSSFLTVAGYFVINISFGSILEPRLLGHGLGLSTLVVFISLLFWGWVFGPVGMVLSVPLTMTIKIALSNSDSGKWLSTLMDAPMTFSSD